MSRLKLREEGTLPKIIQPGMGDSRPTSLTTEHPHLNSDLGNFPPQSLPWGVGQSELEMKPGVPLSTPETLRNGFPFKAISLLIDS